MGSKFRNLLVLIVLVAACSSQAPTPTPVADQPDAANPLDAKDAAVDAPPADAPDAATPADIGADAAQDAAPDADLADAEADADAGSDVEPGSDVETGSDVNDVADAGPDAIQPDSTAPDGTTVDAGPLPKSTHSSACSTTADCQIPCAGGPCLAGKCKFSALKGKAACLVDDGGAEVQCLGAGDSTDATPCLVCTPSISQTSLSPVVTLRMLDSASEGVVTAAVYNSAFTWNYSEKRSMSGGKSLYFGDPVTHSYGNGKRVAGTASLPPLVIPAASAVKPQIAFWLWLDTEETPDKDLLTLTVIAGAQSANAWTSNQLPIPGTTKKDASGAPQWRHVQIDASAWAGQTVQLLFSFDSTDAFINGFEGVYLDDVSVETGCCGAVSDCDDADSCTTDICGGSTSAPVCSHAEKSSCCDNAGDCDDKQVCTLDLCTGGACTHAELPGCCTEATACDDSDDCTHDECGGDNKCSHAATCCKNDSDCKGTNPCEVMHCIAGSCSATVLCCTSEAECDDFNTCTQDACQAGKCVNTASSEPGCCAPVLLNSTFAGTADSWTSSVPVNGVDFHYKDFANAKSAPGVLHFGDPNKAMSLPGKLKFKATASSPPISLLAGKETVLNYQVWADVSNSFSVSVRVYVVVDSVEIALNTSNAGNLQGSWHPFAVDLTPLAGKSFQLFIEVSTTGFGFGTVGGQGIYFDDVTITSTCQPKKCTSSSNCATDNFTCLAGTCADGVCGYSNGCCASSADCDDNSPCTQDTCQLSNKKCQFKAIAGCCVGDGDCNDANACTTDVCPGPGKLCAFNAKPLCCLGAKDCNDGVACTTDTCVANKCVNQNFCCASDKECDDGETKCTTDTCVAKNCVHKPTGVAGCCIPEVWAKTFDGGDLKDMTLTNSTNNTSKGWQLWGASSQTKSAPGALYYGDPTAGNFDFGQSSGLASTPKILLPATPSNLSVWLYMDTESGPTYDNMTINLVVDGGKQTIFTKNVAGFNTTTWFEVKANLSQYAGKEITVEFAFDTADGEVNDGEGVFIDDLKITTNCGG